MLPVKFQLNPVWEEMSFEEFQDGHHLGYRNGTILAILNLSVAPMVPIKFRLNLIYSLGGDVVWRISRWPPWRNDLSNSEILCCSYASHQVSAQSDLWFGRCCLNNFKMAAMADIWRLSWISELNRFSNTESPYTQWSLKKQKYNLHYGKVLGRNLYGCRTALTPAAVK